MASLHDIRWLLLVCGAVLLYVAKLYRAYLRLRAFKGPFSTGWSEIWHTRAILGMRSHLAYKEVTDRYGESLVYAAEMHC